MKISLPAACKNTRTRSFGVIVAIVIAIWSANSQGNDLSSSLLTEQVQQQGAKQ